MANTFMPQTKNEADVTLDSGLRIRIFRQEPFRFMSEIHKWLQDLKIGEVQATHMNTDVNGWINFVIAYREEPKTKVPEGPDPVMVLYDAVMALKDISDILERVTNRQLAPSVKEPREGLD